MVRAPWADRERRDMDGGRQQQVGGCAVVTDAAPPLGAAGVIWDEWIGMHGLGTQSRRWCWRSDAAKADGWMGVGWLMGRAG